LPVSPPSPTAREPLARAVWRRHKWGIIGFGLFLLFELVLFASGGMMFGHF